MILKPPLTMRYPRSNRISASQLLRFRKICPPNIDERGSFLHFVDNTNITARVKSQLLINPNIHGLNIHVKTKNGVAALEGLLNSAVEADLARQIVRNTKGVMDIEDNLTIAAKP